jgi:hypothetical protein
VTKGSDVGKEDKQNESMQQTMKFDIHIGKLFSVRAGATEN